VSKNVSNPEEGEGDRFHTPLDIPHAELNALRIPERRSLPSDPELCILCPFDINRLISDVDYHTDEDEGIGPKLAREFLDLVGTT